MKPSALPGALRRRAGACLHAFTHPGARVAAVLCLLAALLCLCMILPLSACGESRMTQRQVSAMNTIMTLTAYGKKAEIGLNAAEGVMTLAQGTD